MFVCFVFVAIIAGLAQGSPRFRRGPNDCQATDMLIPDGTTVLLSGTWWICKGGQLELISCFDDDGRRLRTGETFIRGNFEITCSISEGDVKYLPTACVSENGLRFRPEENWMEPGLVGQGFSYVCNKVDQFKLERKVVGCVTKKGLRLSPGDSTKEDGKTFVCEKTSGGVNFYMRL